MRIFILWGVKVLGLVGKGESGHRLTTEKEMKDVKGKLFLPCVLSKALMV